MIIQVAINSLGSVAIAASTVALNFEMWAYHVLTGFLPGLHGLLSD